MSLNLHIHADELHPITPFEFDKQDDLKIQFNHGTIWIYKGGLDKLREILNEHHQLLTAGKIK